MKLEKPDFKLTRLAEEDSSQVPEIVSVAPTITGTQIDRRRFLGTSIGAAAALFFLGYESANATPFITSVNTSTATSGTGVTVLGVTSDGKNLISVSDSDTVSLWSLPEGQLLHTRQIDSSLGNLPHVITSPDRSRAAQVDAGQFMLLALSGGLLPARLRERLAGEEVKALSTTPDGKILACTSGNRIDVWSLPDDAPLATRHVDGGEAKALAMNSDGSRLIAASGDGTILSWDLGESGSGDGRKRHQSNSPSLIITREEQLLALAGSAEAVSGSYSSTDQRGNNLPAQSMPQALALTPDGETLSVGYSNGAILLWSPVQTGRGRRRRGAKPRCRGCLTSAPGRGRGRTERRRCTSDPIPPGMVCTCNCVRVR